MIIYRRVYNHILFSSKIISLNISKFQIEMNYKFPNDFIFGASTAAYQIEGGWNEDGKGENIWDNLARNRPEVIKDLSNGDIACDSYHKYKEDVALAKQLNLDFYRFSISWARIAPTGEMNSLNYEGIAYYNRLIDELIANGIAPMVTMYHWDLPQYLQDLGGWVNPIISDYFKEYARVLFSNFGDRVKWWITINEPKETCTGYSSESYAPLLRLNNIGFYLAAHTQLIAHAKAYRLYETMFKSKQKGKVSIAINGRFYYPKNGNSVDDINASERAHQFWIGWFCHPVFKGDYPPIMRQMIDEKCKKEGRPWSTLPIFTEDEIKLVKGTADFFSLNYYSSRLVTREINPNAVENQDGEYFTSMDESKPKSPVAEWLIVVPEGLKQVLSWIKNEYGNPPLVITENGYGDDGQFNDIDRINYLKGHLNSILQAIHEDNCNVIGYTLWSLIDNFEWMFGYTIRFGIVEVDFKDPQRSRKPRASFSFYKNVISTRQLIDAVDI